MIATLLIGLVALHILGALKHGIERDDTLARMIRGRA